VLSAFHPKLQRYSRRRLEEMGVDVRLNTAAIAMSRDGEIPGGPGGYPG
jgi:NADH dehydrogenase